jgi:LysM repeat protein
MKILKIFGLVVGIHLFALVLIFANPGCSSTRKPVPTPADTAASPPPTVSLPAPAPAPAPAPDVPLFAPAAPAFNPDAAATSGVAGGVRFVPTRPGTPVAGTLVAEPVADVTPTSTYVVKSGDSLWTIAKKHNLSLSQLTAANNLPANTNLKPGQKLLIPGKAPAGAVSAPAPSGAAARVKAAEPAPARGGASGTRHTVKSGESLGGIARTYGVKAADIAVANNISDPAKIRAGMELVIPGAEAAKNGKSGAAKSGAPKAGAASAATETNRPPAVPMLMAPPPANQVPVIRIEDNPLTPAPKAP